VQQRPELTSWGRYGSFKEALKKEKSLCEDTECSSDKVHESLIIIIVLLYPYNPARRGLGDYRVEKLRVGIHNIGPKINARLVSGNACIL
jgi:hypothetical protein